MSAGEPKFATILHELSTIRSRKGVCAMPFSFVSKLIGIHQEGSPIYDRHVLSFFRKKGPPASLHKSMRIAQFIDFIGYVSKSYHAWAADERMEPIMMRLKDRDSRLAECHPVRLLDFLVWKVGNQKLLRRSVTSL